MNNALIHFISSFVPTKRLRRLVRKNLKAFTLRKTGTLFISGHMNQIILVNESGEEIPITRIIPGLKIQLQGTNNKIIFHKNINFKGIIEVDSENAVIEFGDNVCGFIRVRAKYGHNQKLRIGNNTTIYDGGIILDENASVEIGSNVLASTQILFQASDGHAIQDSTTKEPINCIKHPLIVEDHVWIGTRVILLKNTHIHKDSVIGAGSITCTDYKDSNVVIAGNPAKIIKTGITWNQHSPWELQTKVYK